MAQPRAEELAAAREEHMTATANQISHEQAQGHDRKQLASMNHGTPDTAAMDSVNGHHFDRLGRIANGIFSGQLTPGETKNLETREARLNGEIHNDRVANAGKLTPQEKKNINKRQNGATKVYEEKHNEKAAPR